jgi:hypothetical protein
MLTRIASDLAGSHSLAGFLRLGTCRLVASCCRSWGSMRFCRVHSGGAGPESPPIAGRVPYRSPHGGFLASRFIPPEGVPLSAAASCHHDRCLLGLFVHRRSATFAPAPFPAPSFQSYRWDAVPRGLSPRRGPYLRSPCSDVRRPLLPGPCSPSRLPLADPCGSVDAWGALRLRHPHVRAPCAFVLVPSVVSPAFAGLVRRAPCRARFSCALATRFASGARRLPRRTPRRTDEAAQAGHAGVAHIVADASFVSVGERPVPSLPTGRRSPSPVRCSFGHRGWQTPRGISPGWRTTLRGLRPSRSCERFSAEPVRLRPRVGARGLETEDEPDGRSSVLRSTAACAAADGRLGHPCGWERRSTLADRRGLEFLSGAEGIAESFRYRVLRSRCRRRAHLRAFPPGCLTSRGFSLPPWGF